MMDGEIRLDFIRLDQAMTTQSKSIYTQSQDMMAQAIKEFKSCVHQNASTMDSHLRTSQG